MTNYVTDTPLDGYRQSVGIFLLNAKDKVFVGNRLNAQSAWQFPQGGIDKDEGPEQAALREMKEEIGTDNATILSVSRYWYSYDLPAEIAAKMWSGRFRGQSQKWIAMRFGGKDGDFDLEAHDPEFSEWKWVLPEDAIDLAVSFKRDIYANVVDEFRHLWA